jgi:lysophospholipase L1-like esterase
MWVARGLGLPFSNYAVDGAVVGDVLNRQIPAFLERAAHPDARFDLGCVYIGVNDVRGFDWDPSRFERDFVSVVAFLAERCDRVLTVTTPLDLGRPRAGAKVGDLDAIVERVAASCGALVLDLRGLCGRNLVMTDHVHPTAFGQVFIAERALSVLERDGMRVLVRPSSLISYETSWWRRLRSDVTYAYRHLKVSLRAGAIVAWFRVRGAG